MKDFGEEQDFYESGASCVVIDAYTEALLESWS